MVLQTLIGFGVIFGAAEGIRHAQAKARREEHRSRKNNLVVHCPKSSEFSPALQGRRVVLSGDKLYIDTGLDNDAPFGHPFAGYFLPYPDARYAGLVSTITDEAPIMNWIYIHSETYEVKFGIRKDSEGNLTGPFDCTRQDRRMTFLGWEGFVAVREGPFWAVYFDVAGDRLKSKLPDGTPVVELELLRRELRTPKPPPPTPDQMSEKQQDIPPAQDLQKAQAEALAAAQEQATARAAADDRAKARERTPAQPPRNKSRPRAPAPAARVTSPRAPSHNPAPTSSRPKSKPQPLVLAAMPARAAAPSTHAAAEPPGVPAPRSFLTPKTPKKRGGAQQASAADPTAASAQHKQKKPPAADVREQVRRFRSNASTESEDTTDESSHRPASMSSTEYETDLVTSPLSST